MRPMSASSFDFRASPLFAAFYFFFFFPFPPSHFARAGNCNVWTATPGLSGYWLYEPERLNARFRERNVSPFSSSTLWRVPADKARNVVVGMDELRNLVAWSIICNLGFWTLLTVCNLLFKFLIFEIFIKGILRPWNFTGTTHSQEFYLELTW